MTTDDLKYPQRGASTFSTQYHQALAYIIADLQGNLGRPSCSDMMLAMEILSKLDKNSLNLDKITGHNKDIISGSVRV